MGPSATLATALAILTLTGHLVSSSPLQQSQQTGPGGLEGEKEVFSDASDEASVGWSGLDEKRVRNLNRGKGLHELYEQLVAAANSNAGSAGSAGLSAAVPPPDSYYGPGLLELLANRLAASGPSSSNYGYGLGGDVHQMVRKSNRTPSLRLRYGRSDPSMKINPSAYQNSR